MNMKWATPNCSTTTSLPMRATTREVCRSGTKSGMPILYDNPREVGADRVVNGIAAYEQYGRANQRAVIVVDFGTATTFDVVSHEGEYVGGALMTGIETSANAG